MRAMFSTGIYGDVVSQWTISAERTAPPGHGAGSLCDACSTLIDELQADPHASSALPLKSLQPQLISSAYNHWRGQIARWRRLVRVDRAGHRWLRRALRAGGWDRVHSVRIGSPTGPLSCVACRLSAASRTIQAQRRQRVRGCASGVCALLPVPTLTDLVWLEQKTWPAIPPPANSNSCAGTRHERAADWRLDFAGAAHARRRRQALRVAVGRRRWAWALVMLQLHYAECTQRAGLQLRSRSTGANARNHGMALRAFGRWPRLRRMPRKTVRELGNALVAVAGRNSSAPAATSSGDVAVLARSSPITASTGSRVTAEARNAQAGAGLRAAAAKISRRSTIRCSTITRSATKTRIGRCASSSRPTGATRHDRAPPLKTHRARTMRTAECRLAERNADGCGRYAACHAWHRRQARAQL